MSERHQQRQLLLGTCGWSYQEWVGLFYPNNRVAKLPFYSKIFDTVEVDSSFYKAPSKPMVSGWIGATQPGFKFSLKVPKTITHDKRLAGAEKEFLGFLDLIEPLSEAGKLGCILFQLPPSFTYDKKNYLEAIFDFLPAHIQFSVEFRHESWNRRETWALLKKHNVANTITDSPVEFLSKPIVTSSSHAMVRWHGRGKDIWYNYSYSKDELQPWVEKIVEITAQVPITYAYFNNHYSSNAPYNSLQFLKMLGRISDVQEKLMIRIEKRKNRESKRNPYAKPMGIQTIKLTDFI